MPADASIYSMIRPIQPGPGPLEQYGSALQLRHMLDSSELSQLQKQQIMRQMADDEATRAAYAESGGDPQKVRDLLYGRGLYKPAMAAEKAGLDAQKDRVGISKTQVETHGLQVKQLRDQLASVQDDAGLAAVRENATRLYGPQVVANMPQSVNDPNFPAWREKQVMDASEFLKRVAPQFSVQDFGGTKGVVQANPYAAGGVTGMQPKTMTPGEIASNSATLRGQNMTDARARETMAQGKWTNDLDRGIQVNMATGETRPIMQGGEALGTKGKPLTESQGRGQMFGTRAAEADKILKRLEGEISVTGLAMKQGAGNLPLIGAPAEMVANLALSENQQKVEQAQRNFVNAVLRQESGAVISPSEFDNAKKQYFAQPGDSKGVIEQKRRNRESAIEGFRIMSGPAGERIATAREQTPQSVSGKIKFLGME